MGFLPEDNGKTYYYFENGMMRDRTADNGDNLWRTSLAYIAYKNPVLEEGMQRCLRWIGPHHVQFYRSVEKENNDVSRDQIIMFLSALKYHDHEIKKYVKATKWKISDKYRLTPDMWLWMRAAAGNRFARRLYYFTQWTVVKAAHFWNGLNISKRKFPAYTLHLVAWQVYTMDGNPAIKRRINDILVDMADDENYLVRLLAGYEVSRSDVESVEPMTDFIWQRYRYSTDKIILRKLTSEEAEYNALDVDVLKAVYEWVYAE